MASIVLTLTREYDLPRTIVWDAFVDADLIDGWLPPGTLAGEVTTLDPLERLVLESGDGILDFRLAELAGGTRGSGTSVTIVITAAGGSSLAAAAWRENLENLEHLLRGHPIEWLPQQSEGAATAHDALDGALDGA